jgi:hypothetical protein
MAGAAIVGLIRAKGSVFGHIAPRCLMMIDAA